MRNLYVGNLPHSTTEADLRRLFEAQGAVEEVSLVIGGFLLHSRVFQ
jgi:RNA recognition motif-containing protein